MNEKGIFWVIFHVDFVVFLKILPIERYFILALSKKTEVEFVNFQNGWKNYDVWMTG